MATKRRKKKKVPKRKPLGFLRRFRQSAAAMLKGLRRKIPGTAEHEQRIDRLVATTDWHDKSFDQQTHGAQGERRASSEWKEWKVL